MATSAAPLRVVGKTSASVFKDYTADVYQESKAAIVRAIFAEAAPAKQGIVLAMTPRKLGQAGKQLQRISSRINPVKLGADEDIQD